MVSILFDSYKRNISYDRAKLKKVGDFYALTWQARSHIIQSRLTVVSHKAKKKQHVHASLSLCDHYSEYLATWSRALTF